MAANFNNALMFHNISSTAGNDDYTMLRVADVYDAAAIAGGAAAGTCTVSKGAAAITNAISVNAGLNTYTAATSIDDLNNSMIVGDTLRVAKSAGVLTWTMVRFAAPGVTA